MIDNRVLSEALKKLEGELREVRQELEERVAEKEAEIDRLNQKMESASQAINKAQEKVVQADADLKENSEERKQLLSRYCHYITLLTYMRVFGLGFVTGKLSQYFTKPDGHFKLKVCFNCIVCTQAEKG